MFGLRAPELIILIVVFGGAAAVAFAVIMSNESSKPQPPQFNPHQQMPLMQQTPPATGSDQVAGTAQFCAQCGAKLEANASFCQNCGAPVNHQ